MRNNAERTGFRNKSWWGSDGIGKLLDNPAKNSRNILVFILRKTWAEFPNNTGRDSDKIL